VVDTLRTAIIAAITTEAIQSKLNVFTSEGTQYYAIFAGRLIPEQYQTLNNTILVYYTTPKGPGDIRPMRFTVSCRQDKQFEAIELGELVYTALNRTFSAVTGGKYYAQATMQAPIFEEVNCWHVPVEIYMRNNL